jgi:hypothetical protein
MCLSTYDGLQVLGNDKIIETTMAHIPKIADKKMKNVHFLITGQFQLTKFGMSLVTTRFKVPF